jgi:hypothetical protein
LTTSVNNTIDSDTLRPMVALSDVFSFPNPVNEKTARVVASGVALLAAITLLTGWQWLLLVLALGFLARVLSGPTLSVLGQVANRVIAPRLGPPTLVPGPPKRFAQAIGLALTTTAAVATLVSGLDTLAVALVAILLVFATLESVVGFCAGCWLFGLLMKAGLIPEETCEACNNIWARYSDGARRDQSVASR